MDVAAAPPGSGAAWGLQSNISSRNPDNLERKKTKSDRSECELNTSALKYQMFYLFFIPLLVFPESYFISFKLFLFYIFKCLFLFSYTCKQTNPQLNEHIHTYFHADKY